MKPRGESICTDAGEEFKHNFIPCKDKDFFEKEKNSPWKSRAQTNQQDRNNENLAPGLAFVC